MNKRSKLIESAVTKIVNRVLNEAPSNGNVNQKIYNRILQTITDEFDVIDPSESRKLAESLIGFLQQYTR